MVAILITSFVVLTVVFYFVAIRFMRQLLVLGIVALFIGLVGFGVLEWGPKDVFVHYLPVHPWIWGWISISLLLIGSATSIGAVVRCTCTRFKN